MTRRRIRIGWLTAAALFLAAPAAGQFPRQYTPPPRAPQTEEPALADKTKARDVPEILRPSVIGAAPTTGIKPVAANPVTPDPPTPSVSIHVSAPASASAGADIKLNIVAENK